MVRDASEVRVSGPLAPFADGFAVVLGGLGYAPVTAAAQVRVLAHLSRWMTSEGLAGGELSSARVEEFLAMRRGTGSRISLRGLAPLLPFLRDIGVIPAASAVTVEGPVEELLVSYRQYLVSERGLAAATVRRCVLSARRFLLTCEVVPDATSVGGLTAAHVRGFVMRECMGRNVGSAQVLVSEMRCLLRFLLVTGWASTDLSPMVPSVSGRRDSGLVKALPRGVVTQLLEGCDERTEAGSRDRAVFVLLSRLGIRAGEVAALALDDIGWRSGELTIRGKGNRVERLPLPVDVGEVLARYLQHRHRSEHRSVFLSVRAPYRPVTAGAISSVVRRVCVRAGVPVVGPHALRHTAATDLLGAGASLTEVSQVLRHRSLTTTAIYAKVDVAALRSLALPWPGAGE